MPPRPPRRARRCEPKHPTTADTTRMCQRSRCGQARVQAIVGSPMAAVTPPLLGGLANRPGRYPQLRSLKPARSCPRARAQCGRSRPAWTPDDTERRWHEAGVSSRDLVRGSTRRPRGGPRSVCRLQIRSPALGQVGGSTDPSRGGWFGRQLPACCRRGGHRLGEISLCLHRSTLGRACHMPPYSSPAGDERLSSYKEKT
jgi:hypothetical protein